MAVKTRPLFVYRVCIVKIVVWLEKMAAGGMVKVAKIIKGHD